MNAIHLTGRLTRDPELRSASGGQTVCAMRVAVDGPREGPTYIAVVAFGGLGERCGEYLSRGRAIAVSGRLGYSEWEAGDGSRRSKHEVIANQVDFLPGARSNDKEPAQQAAS